MKIKKDIKSLSKSFSYAIQGLWFCIRNERNMRIHFVIILFVLLFSRFYDFTNTEFIMLLLTFSSVIVSEMLNTALETVVNLVSQSYHQLAKLAKDISAGAVFISAVFSVTIGVILFWDLDTFTKIYQYFCDNPKFIFGLFVLIIISIIFIFRGFTVCKKIQSNKYKVISKK